MNHRTQWRSVVFKLFIICAAQVGICFASSVSFATDISGVQAVAVDLPQTNFYVTRTDGGQPLSGDFLGLGFPTFNITAFLDTGTSGIVLSEDTADALGILRQQAFDSASQTNLPIIFRDVAVGGTTDFNVSEPVYLGIAPNSPTADIGNAATYSTVYNQKLGPVSMQIGPLSDESSLFPIDLVGMPAMLGKIVVMDPKPADSLLDSIHTYLYEPGETFHPGTQDNDPGVPLTNTHVALSYASFERFTEVVPEGAPGPTLAHNPFIGPSPLASSEVSTLAEPPSGIGVSYQGFNATGSFLLDTGAQMSVISTALAAQLHVRYVPGTEGTDDPQLETFDPADPSASGAPIDDVYTAEFGGLGGGVTAAGFFLDSLLLHTVEATPGDDNDPHNIRFLHAPILIADIKVEDPKTFETITLDGLFGMNYLAASFSLTPTASADDLGLVPSSFNWIVFNEPDGVLGLDLKGVAVPEPSGWILACTGLLILFARTRRKRYTES